MFVESGEFAVEIGASSRDTRLTATVTVNGTMELPLRYTRESTVGDLLKTAKGRTIENLLKKKKAGRRDTPQNRSPSQDPSAPEPELEGSPSPPQAGPEPTAPRVADQPRIKTREAVAAREGSASPPRDGRTEPVPAAGSERQKIKIRESTVHGGHRDMVNGLSGALQAIK